MNLVDYHGAGIIMFIFALFELYTFCYIYGVNRVCVDAKFMLGFTPGIFWRICWWFVTPMLMTIIVTSEIIGFKPLEGDYPLIAQVIGWCITLMGVIWFPILLFMRIVSRQEDGWSKVKIFFSA